MRSDSDKNQFNPFIWIVVTGIVTAMCSVTRIFRVGSEVAEFAVKDGVCKGFIDQTNEVLRCIESKEKVTTEIVRRREKLENLEIEYNSLPHLAKNKRENLMCRITNEKEAVQHLEQIEQNWDCIISCEKETKYYLEKKEKTIKLRKGKRQHLQENADECVRRKQEAEQEIQELEGKIVAIDEAEVKYIKKIEEMDRTKLENEKKIPGRAIMIIVFFWLFVCGLCCAAYYFGVF